MLLPERAHADRLRGTRGLPPGRAGGAEVGAGRGHGRLPQRLRARLGPAPGSAHLLLTRPGQRRWRGCRTSRPRPRGDSAGTPPITTARPPKLGPAPSPSTTPGPRPRATRASSPPHRPRPTPSPRQLTEYLPCPHHFLDPKRNQSVLKIRSEASHADPAYEQRPADSRYDVSTLLIVFQPFPTIFREIFAAAAAAPRTCL